MQGLDSSSLVQNLALLAKKIWPKNRYGISMRITYRSVQNTMRIRTLQTRNRVSSSQKEEVATGRGVENSSLRRGRTSEGGMESGFGAHLTPHEAIRRLTAMGGSGCSQCAPGARAVGATESKGMAMERARSVPVPTLRHYSRTPELPDSPSMAPKLDPPNSPPTSFWGTFFDRSPTSTSPASPTSSFGQRTFSVPPLWRDMQEQHDPSTP